MSVLAFDQPNQLPPSRGEGPARSGDQKKLTAQPEPLDLHLHQPAGGEVVLLDRGHLGQIDMVEEKLDVLIVGEEVRHERSP